MTLFILINVQNRIVLIIILLNLLDSPRIFEQITGHGGRDKKSHLFKHAVVDDQRNANRKNPFKRKVADALLIKLSS